MNARLKSGLEALEQGRAEDAWVQVKLVLEKEPKNAFALSVGVMALRRLGLSSKAEQLRRKSAGAAYPAFPAAEDLDFMRRLDELDRRRGAAERLAEQAGKFIKEGRVQQAEALLNRAKGLEPANAVVQYYRGMFAAVENRPAVARLCFVSALKSDGGLDRAREALSRLLSGKSLASLTALL